MPISPLMTPLPQPVTAVVALEPVYNILMSMVALRDPENYGGLDEWVLHVVSRMAPALQEQHRLLFDWLWLDALTNAVDRGPATESFPAYLAALAAQPATGLRDKLFYWFLHSPHMRVGYEYRLITPPEPADLLADYDAFALFMEERARAKIDEVSGVHQMYTLFNQPEQLQLTLVTHLQTLWEEYLAAEWQRVQPKLQATVDAFQAARLDGLPMLEAIQVVTGRDLRPAFRLDALLAYRRVRFIPHLHNGPYVLWFGDDEELRIGFAAHQPPMTAQAGALFDLGTLTNRYQALADETRLAMLLALRTAQELSTQELIDRFGLDKSAASRHLRQLVATSLIEERRVDGAKKVYRVNRGAVTELIELLTSLG
ncbi:MAG: ArsR family transcriptional regulator [Caldilinea sp. CFX5]|nr:ArsR family transcriptional regulator [Caldilinea sp. CFX5]